MRDRRTATPAALLRRVLANLEQNCGVRSGDRLLVAVSGGADSVALFQLLRAAAPSLRLELQLAHFDHALRQGSAADAAWVAALGRAYDVPVHVQVWQAPQTGEAAAREARHAFLAKTARAHGCAAIALAHHREDQMETILLRLARGTGVRGALGMAWRREGNPAIVRPLLDVTRADLRAALTASGDSWREDPTNLDRGAARNRVRHDVLPALDAALGGRWQEHWTAAWSDLRELWSWADALGAELLGRAAGGAAANRLRIDVLQAAPEPVLRAALLRWLDAAPDGASRAQLNGVVHLVRAGRSGKRIQLAGGFEVAVEQGLLARYPNAMDARPAVLLEIHPVDGATARHAIAAPLQARDRVTPEAAEAYLAAEAIRPPVRLRAARPGDRIQLLGAPGHRPVARVLQDHRVARRARGGWPVVEDAQGLVWIPGIGVAERVRVGPNTLSALWLRTRGTPAPEVSGTGRRGLPEPRVEP